MSNTQRGLSVLFALLFVGGVASAGRGPGLMTGPGTVAGTGVLAYEGLVSKRTTKAGVETQVATCSASVIDLPGRGPKLVTAGHCEGTDPIFFDERGRMKPTARRDLQGGPDVAVFDLIGKSPWTPLATRATDTLRKGETLCAFHATRANVSVQRKKICGTFVGRTTRLDASNRPRLVIDHPFEKGTSGSPLFDSAGKVVGIVVSTTAEEGFAEPIEEAFRVAVAPTTSTKDNPKPAEPADGGFFGGLFPREGSVCLSGFCFRWEI